MRENLLIQSLRAGRTATCLPLRISRTPHIAYMAKAAGFDALYVDMEQSNVSFSEAGQIFQASWAAGITPLVRVPRLEAETIARVLDDGAGGVIVPHVENALQARAVVDAARFAPLGRRSTAGAGLTLGYAGSSAESRSAANGGTIVIAMIESAHAVANAMTIAAVDGIDMLFVGTGDLSRELGIHGNHRHTAIRAAYETVGAACRHHHRWLGVAGIKGAASKDVLGEFHKLGARFLSAHTDEALLRAAVEKEGVSVREIFAS